jgi:hypothetical protein
MKSGISTRVSHHEYAGITRHSPRNGFNGFLRALPGDRACLPPSSTDCSADLTPASGRQDHTTSPSASASPVKRASASTASRPASVTSRAAPLSGTGRRGYRFESGQARSGIFLRRGLDREVTDLPVGQISCAGRISRRRNRPSERKVADYAYANPSCSLQHGQISWPEAQDDHRFERPTKGNH